MAFLAPLFLLGAAAAAIPVVLHLLKQRTETRVKFSAVSMLREGPVEGSRRRQLRELLLLALRVAALLLLALAFARPFLRYGASRRTGITVVALDTSLSMTAPGQFDRARQLARDVIRRAPGGDACSVVTFADSAQVVVPPTGDRALALAAIDDAAPGFGGTDYGSAVNAAAESLAVYGAERATVVVVTDLQESGWKSRARGSLPDAARLEVVDVGAPPPNLAVVSVRADGGQAIATIRNTGPTARDAHVHLSVDGREVAQEVVSVPVNESADVTLAGARGVSAEVRVDDPTGVQGDNARFVVLNNAGPPSILVITTNGDLPRDAFYVEQALIAPAGGRPAYSARGIAAPALATDSLRLDQAAGVLLVSTRGLDQRGRDALANFLVNGGSLLVAAGDDVDGAALEEVLGAASFRVTAADARAAAPPMRTLAPADSRHPVFQGFGMQAPALGLVKFSHVERIGGAGCQTLATFTTGESALMDCSVGKGRALVFASDLGNRWNDFPLHFSFVPFLHEAIKYLAGGRTSQHEYLIGDAPPGTPPQPGIRTVPDQTGRVIRSVAVNVDPAESDPRRMKADEFGASVARVRDVGREGVSLESRQREEGQRLWQYVIGLMLAALLAESLVARRA